MKSGDLCRLKGVRLWPAAYQVEHFRCDKFADGTITDARTGKVITPAKPGAKKGFKR